MSGRLRRTVEAPRGVEGTLSKRLCSSPVRRTLLVTPVEYTVAASGLAYDYRRDTPEMSPKVSITRLLVVYILKYFLE